MSRGKRTDPAVAVLVMAIADLGVSPTAIAKRLGKSHNTVLKYLRSEVYNDPSISQLVELIKEKELPDLYLLGAKGRQRL